MAVFPSHTEPEALIEGARHGINLKYLQRHGSTAGKCFVEQFLNKTATNASTLVLWQNFDISKIDAFASIPYLEKTHIDALALDNFQVFRTKRPAKLDALPALVPSPDAPQVWPDGFLVESEEKIEITINRWPK